MPLPRLLLTVSLLAFTASTRGEPVTRPFVLDMVHHNPGEPETKSMFLDPALLRPWGFTGNVPGQSEQGRANRVMFYPLPQWLGSGLSPMAPAI